MRGIELAPFKGRREKIGPKLTTDSVVGRILEAGPVIKWSRRNFADPQEAQAAAKFIRKSVDLYREALGEEYVVPTAVCTGQKKDGSKTKFKVYTQQPFVDGWRGDLLPEEVKIDPILETQWESLYDRLSRLYRAAREVNGKISGSEEQAVFPINLTLGDSRRAALLGQIICELPATPNLIVEGNTLRIKIFDWGPYTPWQESMAEPYDRIRELSLSGKI